jgi:hypothetical protein
MKFAAFASLIILLGVSSAFAADTESGTAGRPTAVLSKIDCATAWRTAAGPEFDRFHRTRDGLSPTLAKGIITNFQQADADNDGSISHVEFVRACELGLVTSGIADGNKVADY